MRTDFKSKISNLKSQPLRAHISRQDPTKSDTPLCPISPDTLLQKVRICYNSRKSRHLLHPSSTTRRRKTNPKILVSSLKSHSPGKTNRYDRGPVKGWLL